MEKSYKAEDFKVGDPVWIESIWAKHPGEIVRETKNYFFVHTLRNSNYDIKINKRTLRHNMDKYSYEEMKPRKYS